MTAPAVRAIAPMTNTVCGPEAKAAVRSRFGAT
jgi:hypothetical protein